MAPHSGTLAWKIPWTEEPGKLQSMGSRRVGHDRANSLSLFTFMNWRRKWQPSVLAWRILGTGEPGGLLSLGSHRVGHDWSNLAAAALEKRISFLINAWFYYEAPWWLSWLRIHLQWRRPGFNPWTGKIPWRREMLSTQVFYPGEFHGLNSPWGHKRVGHNWSTFTFTLLSTMKWKWKW